jgi:hypothetical protein
MQVLSGAFGEGDTVCVVRKGNGLEFTTVIQGEVSQVD